MPLYTYKRESTGEHRDVFQGMNDVHEYFGEDGTEQDWKRVWHVPQMAMDTNIDPFNNEAFVEKTRGGQGTYGDLMDQSAELSEQRARLNGGVDPVKEKYYKDYSAKRNGAVHPDKKRKTFESSEVSVEY